MSDVSRRRFLGLLGAGGLVGAAAGAGAMRIGDRDGVSLDSAVAFDGPYQAGIITPAQDRLHFAAFDLTTTSRDELIALLKDWTVAARRMTAGLEAGPGGAVPQNQDVPPEDTGEALGLSPSQLTITIGFGPTLFTKDGVDRFGLASRRPAALVDIPPFPADDLNPAISNGDLAIQACSNDPQVAVHAVRNLARIGRGRAEVRWSQLGFGRTSSTSTAQATPRNLFGFKDGTANLKLEDPTLLRDWVWANKEDDSNAGWMHNGSYLVTRRIRMHIETWDRAPLFEQEMIVGRDKGEGAPLTGVKEFDLPDFDVKRDGEYVISRKSHVHLAHPTVNDGAELLRRGFSFTDGTDGLGKLDAGLFFICFQRDPRKQFIPIQKRLAANDLMNEYLKHTSSAVFACPAGTKPDEYWGQALFS